MIGTLRALFAFSMVMGCAVLSQVARYLWASSQVVPNLMVWAGIVVFAAVAVTIARQAGFGRALYLGDWDFKDNRWQVVGSYGWPTPSQTSVKTVTMVYLALLGPNMEHRLVWCHSDQIVIRPADGNIHSFVGLSEEQGKFILHTKK